MMPLLIVRKKAKRVDVDVGPGLSMGRLRDSVTISLSKKKRSFEGAWYVSGEVEQKSVRVQLALGFVNLVEARIGGVLMSGIDAEGNPVPGGRPWLEGQPKYSATGLGYVCVRLRVEEKEDSDGKTGELVEGEVEVVLSDKFGANGDEWLQPLATYDALGGIHQLAFFDYSHSAKKDDNGDWVHSIVPSMSESETSVVGSRAIIGAPASVNYGLKRWDMD